MFLGMLLRKGMLFVEKVSCPLPRKMKEMGKRAAKAIMDINLSCYDQLVKVLNNMLGHFIGKKGK